MEVGGKGARGGAIERDGGGGEADLLFQALVNSTPGGLMLVAAGSFLSVSSYFVSAL